MSRFFNKKPPVTKALFNIFCKMLIERSTDSEINIREIISARGEHTMIVETLMEMQKKWVNKGKQQGIREGIQKGKQQGIQEGKQIGAKETLVKTAIQLLKEGLDIEFIARVTGLSENEIEKLKKNLNA